MATDYLDLLTRLRDSKVDFVIVGGVAAALHGGSRVTFDLDLVPSPEPSSWAAAIDLLWSLGARPRIPEPRERVRNIRQVERWKTEKGMLALTMRTTDGSVEVDFLVSETPRFENLRDRAVAVTVDENTFLVASIEDLIAMKKAAGRPQDLLDVAELEEIKKRTKQG